MSQETAVPIPLNVWQDPQGDVVLHMSREGCAVYFGCWVAAGEPADYTCMLSFNHAWAIKGANSEFLPYKCKENLRSCIYEIENSEWLKQESARRSETYPQWKEWDKRNYHHYVVSGHDNFFEVIAAEFDEQVLSRSEAGELARLSDEA